MSLMAQIKEKQLQARKSGFAESVIYTTLLGEAAIIGKNDGNRETTDAEVISVVKKFIKNIDDTLGYLQNSIEDALTDRREELLAERKALEQFLPLQLTELAIEHFIREKVSSGVTNMGLLMKALKDAHDGQYDGKVASAVVKKVLSQ